MQIAHTSRCSLYFSLVFLLCTVGRNCAQICQSTNFTSPKFQSNLNTVLNSFVSNRSVSERFNTSVSGNSTPYTVYGLFQCWADTTADECLACAQEANCTIRKCCGNATGGRAWLRKCFIRYETSDFFGTLDLNFDAIDYNKQKVTDKPNVFSTAVRELFTNLSGEALQSPVRYASGSTVTSTFYPIYAFVQCWRDLTAANDCKICLASAIQKLLGVTLTENGSFVGGVSHCGSCKARYETYSFFHPAPPPPPIQLTPVSSPVSEKKSPDKKAMILGIVGGLLVMLLLCLFAIQRKIKRTVLWRRPGLVNKENLDTELSSAIGLDHKMIIDLETIKAATRDFHEDNKLGEGGFGTVYKGTLQNGLQIAVKKLCVESLKGKEQFLNEVKLVGKVQHRNLVILLGCCAEGSERLLIYEFLPNNSLDKILFHPERRKELDWNRRLNIILGVARGLLYLHEDSQVPIIHRDIKASNILLDDKMEPKISDFGLARLFCRDKSHVNTRVAGTLGYMAPEYARRGRLSIKADVYSFGVVILEIICGRKNADDGFSIDFQSLVEWVWKSYRGGKIEDVIDKAIIKSFPNEQISRCIHVGLLCTQDDAANRPTMATVYAMLSNPSVTNLPDPTRPAFLSATRIENQSQTSTSTETSSSSSSPPIHLVYPSINEESVSDMGSR